MQVDVVLVGVGKMGMEFLPAARSLGLRLGVIESQHRLRSLLDEHSDVVVAGQSVDATAAACDESWVEPAISLTRRCSARGVLGFSEPHVVAAALAAETHGLPGTGFHAAQLSRNKALQRQVYGANALPQPHFRILPKLAQAVEGEPSLPFVVKPLSGAGSRGVERIQDAPQWRDVLARRGGEGPLLVESYVEGREYSWEALVWKGELVFSNLTAKTTTGPPHFVELLHLPGAMSANGMERDAADLLGMSVVEALRLQEGIVHVEFKMSDQGAVLMEAAVRPPGDFLMEVVSRAYGIDLFGACLQLAMGDRPKVPDPDAAPLRHTAALFFAASRPGLVVPDDVGSLPDVPGVFSCGLRQDPGVIVGPPEGSGDRLAYALLDCDSPAELSKCARAAEAAVGDAVGGAERLRSSGFGLELAK